MMKSEPAMMMKPPKMVMATMIEFPKLLKPGLESHLV